VTLNNLGPSGCALRLARRTVTLAQLASVEPVDAVAFLCHSSGDKERVRALYQRLEGDGVRCWFDEDDLLPGQDWDYEISRAIRSSQFVLACLSQQSIHKSGYLQKELRKALDVAAEPGRGRLPHTRTA
jgi:hypothetical protein